MISVIMCVYKEKLQWIKESIQSIIEQTYKNFELLIIIDNPKLDNEVRNYLIEMESCDERIKLLFNEKNEGPSYSRNRGIMQASGEYIALMDSDDIASINRLEIERQFMTDNGYDCVGSMYYIVDENSCRSGKSEVIKKDINSLLKYSNYIVNSTLLLKKSKAEEVGGYRNFNTCEDYDFILKLLSAGCKFGIVDEFLMSYRVSNGSRSNRSVASTRNDYYYIQQLYKERIRNGTSMDSYSKDNYEKYLLKHSGKNVERRYSKVNSDIQQAIDKLKNRHFIACFGYFIRSLIVDFNYARKEISLRIKIMRVK